MNISIISRCFAADADEPQTVLCADTSDVIAAPKVPESYALTHYASRLSWAPSNLVHRQTGLLRDHRIRAAAGLQRHGACTVRVCFTTCPVHRDPPLSQRSPLSPFTGFPLADAWVELRRHCARNVWLRALGAGAGTARRVAGKTHPPVVPHCNRN